MRIGVHCLLPVCYLYLSACWGGCMLPVCYLCVTCIYLHVGMAVCYLCVTCMLPVCYLYLPACWGGCASPCSRAVLTESDERPPHSARSENITPDDDPRPFTPLTPPLWVNTSHPRARLTPPQQPIAYPTLNDMVIPYCNSYGLFHNSPSGLTKSK